MMDYRNPFYSNAEGTMIDMEINHEIHGWIPFTASQTDVEPHGRELYEAAKASGNTQPYTPPTATQIRANMRPLTRLQFRQKMKKAGIGTAEIEKTIAKVKDPSRREDLQIFWENAQQFRRLGAFTHLVAESLTDDQLDAIWMAKEESDL